MRVHNTCYSCTAHIQSGKHVTQYRIYGPANNTWGKKNSWIAGMPFWLSNMDNILMLDAQCFFFFFFFISLSFIGCHWRIRLWFKNFAICNSWYLARHIILVHWEWTLDIRDRFYATVRICSLIYVRARCFLFFLFNIIWCIPGQQCTH